MKDASDVVLEAAEALGSGKSVSDQLVAAIVTLVSNNLAATETLIARDYKVLGASAVLFFLFDRGVVASLPLGGLILGDATVLYVAFPLLSAFLAYQLVLRLSFSHELRTFLALLMRQIQQNLYVGCVDLLLHAPSIRNIESGLSRHHPARFERLTYFTTSRVADVMFFGPPTVAIYQLVRLSQRVNIKWWVPVLVGSLCAVFLVRAVLVGVARIDQANLYSKRATFDSAIKSSAGSAA